MAILTGSSPLTRIPAGPSSPAIVFTAMEITPLSSLQASRGALFASPNRYGTGPCRKSRGVLPAPFHFTGPSLRLRVNSN